LRLAAFGLAFLSGWGFGSRIPLWKLDSWVTFAEFRTNWSFSTFAWLLLLIIAFVLAAFGWPPLWPLKSHPTEFLAITVFQRWIWYTLGAFLAGHIASGTTHMLYRWFKR